MIYDALQLPDGTVFETDVCIIGAGAAGIAIAVELADSPVKVLLLESGGFEEEDASRDLSAGENNGIAYGPLEALRARFFGGSTNKWGGWSRPFDREDFEPRAWVRNSGWPISRADLVPFYKRASERLLLGNLDYDPANVDRIADPSARLIPLPDARIESLILRFSPPARFGNLYRETLHRAGNIQCMLHANAIELVADSEAARVDTIRVATLDGKAFQIKPRVAVLAAGGIENARLLLLSNRVSQNGLGNENDLVGRYFMEHPLVRTGRFQPERGTQPPLDLYDATFSYHNPAFSIDGVEVAAYLAATPDVERKEELLRHRVLFSTVYRGEDAPGTEALRRLTRHSRRVDRSRNKPRDAALVLANAPSVITAVVGRRFKLARLAKELSVLTIVEPEPIPTSRVTLGDTRCALGLRRARITWSLSPAVKRTSERVTEIVGEELARAGVGTLEAARPEGDPFQAPLWCWHHIGTTRMSADPRAGVVDANGRVHSISNLYVAGSSVFPTAGCDMPTLTIVALAIRMATYIREELENRRVD